MADLDLPAAAAFVTRLDDVTAAAPETAKARRERQRLAGALALWERLTGLTGDAALTYAREVAGRG